MRDVPQPDDGAPLPIVLGDEHKLLLAYLISEIDPNWDGSYVTAVSPASDSMAVACVCFKGSWAHMFGPPNDEAFSGHPLADRGLHPYAVFEVQDSSWIRKLERMNAVHPQHNPDRFLGLRHFVFAFHDSTFECVAEGELKIEVFRGSMRSALDHMTRLLSEEADRPSTETGRRGMTMSWRAGANLFREMWPLIQRHVPEEQFRAEFVRDLIDFFQNCDMDGTDLRRLDPEIDEALDDLGVGEG